MGAVDAAESELPILQSLHHDCAALGYPKGIAALKDVICGIMLLGQPQFSYCAGEVFAAQVAFCFPDHILGQGDFVDDWLMIYFCDRHTCLQIINPILFLF